MDQNYDEEEATRAAIAASLETMNGSRQGSSKPSNNNLVDLTEDSDDCHSATHRRSSLSGVDDPDLLYAVELSLRAQINNASDVPKQPDSNSSQATNPAPVYGILGMDRKKQEEERLARLAKKRAAEDMSPLDSVRQTKAARSEASTAGIHSQSGSKPATSSVEPGSGFEYPDGTVKKTWASGYKRDNDITFEEVIQKSDLNLAVLSSFQWDTDWLFTKFHTRDTRFLLVMGAKEESARREIEEDFAGISNVRLVLPPMDGQVNCMHSKLMLLFHPGRLRIAIPSANLVPYDWGEQGGFMENVVFLIDLPRKSPESADTSSTPFLEELKYFMKASKFHDNIITKLDKFDFSKTAKYAFVHTIGGSHAGNTWKRTGHCGLGTAVDVLGLRTSQPLKLDYITSSVGSLNHQFMRSMYLAAQGDNGLRELTLRTSKKFPSDKWGVRVQETDGKDWKENTLVYFPSLKTVADSKAGKHRAGTICFQSKWYNAPTFPSDVMRDNLSVRDGTLMHNKMLFVRPQPSTSAADEEKSACRGWAYVGSANLSESAWGRLVLDRTTQQPKLNCRNWECGVLIPVLNQQNSHPEESQTQQADGNSEVPDIFSGHVPVPMRMPGPSYASRQTRPWFWGED